MVEMLLSYLALYGLKENVFINGAGALQVQREKMYKSFRYLNALLLILGIVITSTISYFLDNYVYSKIDIDYLSITVNIFVVASYNLLVSLIWSKGSPFKRYLYENSFSYGFDVVYTLSVIFLIDTSVKMIPFVMSLLAISLVVMIMNILIGFYIKSMNRGYLNIHFRNVSARLFLLAIFSILLFYASSLVI